MCGSCIGTHLLLHLSWMKRSPLLLQIPVFCMGGSKVKSWNRLVCGSVELDLFDCNILTAFPPLFVSLCVCVCVCVCPSMCVCVCLSKDLSGALDAATECQKQYGQLPRIHDIIVALVETGDTEQLQKGASSFSLSSSLSIAPHPSPSLLVFLHFSYLSPSLIILHLSSSSSISPPPSHPPPSLLSLSSSSSISPHPSIPQPTLSQGVEGL